MISEALKCNSSLTELIMRGDEKEGKAERKKRRKKVKNE